MYSSMLVIIARWPPFRSHTTVGGGGHQVDKILLEAVAENSVILGEEDQHFCNYPHLKKPRRGAAAS